MAAYAALSSLTKTSYQLLIFLQTYDEEQQPQQQQLQKEIESLLDNVYFLRACLENYHRKTSIKAEAYIRDAANETEDIMGRFMSEQLWWWSSYYQYSELADDAIPITAPPQDSVELYPTCFTELRVQLQRVSGRLSSMVEKINNTLSIPADDLLSMKINNSSYSRWIAPSRKEESVGLEYEFNVLKSLLIGEPKSPLKAVSILGIGGAGKTTLARKFYNHPSVVELFDIYGWVTVSLNYSARDVLSSLVASIQPFIKEPKQRYESLENYLHRNLQKRRYFIVLDDVWSVEAFEFMMRIFPDDCNGSRILLTTRLKEVAVQADPKNQMYFNMALLDSLEGRNLLLCKVFKHEPVPSELEVCVMRIVERCNGWPLAIVLVAGMLSAGGKSQSMWEQMVNELDCTRYHEAGDEKFHQIMSLSYSHLPHHLRSFFLYMGAFPEDHEINVSKLTKLWLAQGFLHEPGTSLSSEFSEADECLHELVERNLVLVVKRKSDGRIKSCSLHDMVRDFCIQKAQEEGFLRYVMDHNVDQDLAGRRIKITFDLDNLEHICDSGSDDTHTIICFGSGRAPQISIGRFWLLKTLDMVNIEFKSFPMEVLELLLLRLLALSHIAELPPFISNLQFLETLIINPRDASLSAIHLPSTVCLPFEIWAMAQLKNLISFCCGVLPNIGGEYSGLENLETLSSVMNLDCTENTLRMIPKIKKLGIFYFGVGRATHSLKNLERLHQLEKLKLWVLVPFSSPQSLDLGFPITLKKLTLRGIQLFSRDMEIVGALPNLQVLKLRHNTFQSDQWRINSGEFPKLKYLLLEESDVRHWIADDVNMMLPMLQNLVIRACNDLKEIPKAIGDIPTLELIEVVKGNKSLVHSARNIKEKRGNIQNQDFEVLMKN